MNNSIVLAAGAALMLAGCGEKNAEPPATLDAATSVTQARQVVQAKQSAAAPRGDAAVPLESYQELTSGKQLLYAFLAASTLPINFEKVAEHISPEYSGERDEFKKRDLLVALQPAIQREVDKAKVHPYYVMTIGGNVLDKYDFSQQAFRIPELSDASASRYFYDLSAYRMGFSDAQAFSSLKVADEDTARSIEGLRSKYQELRLRVYAFVNDTELGQTKAKAQIMRIQLVDKQGRVLAQQ
ncbi:MAG: hypothetical protein QM772_03370 [Ottowia sp.]|uniref:hypothetical protein n=1 Tax=Ottowia sp. TaxID=1898956 RepID=UPI0039E28BFD